jgi:hypothetical protein
VDLRIAPRRARRRAVNRIGLAQSGTRSSPISCRRGGRRAPQLARQDFCGGDTDGEPDGSSSIANRLAITTRIANRGRLFQPPIGLGLRETASPTTKASPATLQNLQNAIGIVETTTQNPTETLIVRAAQQLRTDAENAAKDDENPTVNRSSRLHQVTASTSARAQRPLPSADLVPWARHCPYG